MEAKLQKLKTRLIEIDDLGSAAALLHWDQSTYMPPGGAPARARQLATLGRLAHEKFTDPAIGQLLEDLRPYEESLPYDSDEASLIRVARRGYEKAVKVPSAFVATFRSHTAESYQVWTKARPANDFNAVQPYLEKTLDFSRQLADFFPGYEHIADPLIHFADEGMKASTVRTLFADLREQLVPIVQAITAQPVADDSCLRQIFPETQQWAFGLEVIQHLGYDLGRGRQDKTHHPFMTKFSLGDVRITNRIKENHLSEALFSTMHEAGHALYEQGIRMDFEGTPLADGTSAGVHESQSRLWENIVGRSRGFWRFCYPKLQAVFPDQLGSVPLDTFYRAINKVERSLIRTDADEVTYNLHVMMRFDFELALLEGKLAVRDLPEAWRERFKADLGIVPPDDRDGVLQDVHWYGGSIGGSFQGYTLGNILGAQCFETALEAHPEIPTRIESGEFGTLHGWLKEHIYQHGRKYTAPELIERVTGGPLSIAPYIRYLRTKYGELYRL
ncbi:carboxypeptidase M32 [Candidatus Poribacteria bacterium]|nr:carboxypeptidase M32 [Candidatus Poribacteria bacterium]